MKKYIIILAGLFLLAFSACKKSFLDEEIKQNFDEELFLKSGFSNLKAFGMGVYNYLPQLNDYGGNALLAAASDEADYAKPANIQRFNTGAWGPFNTPDNAYGDYFKGIRHANLFLEKTTDYKSLIAEDTVSNSGRSIYIVNLDDFVKLRAEVRFLRAYYYMELIKRYGG
ncbi:MAG TPA: RagB/SusD family nutrient uptake outer membrane protein, partial [Pelobium sp.]|nr:RagB/SusD family nutrient uptake outer membrane protein [Pelobium sp.]